MKQLICGIFLLFSISIGSQVSVTTYQATTVNVVKTGNVQSNFVPPYPVGTANIPKTAYPEIRGQQNIKAVMPDREQTKVEPIKDSISARSDYPKRVYEIDYLTSKMLNDEIFKKR